MERTLSREEQMLICVALNREVGHLSGELIEAAGDYDIDRIERLTKQIRVAQKLLSELNRNEVHVEIKR